VFDVSGATVVDGSVSQSARNGTHSSTTARTVTLGLAVSAPPGGAVSFPEARFDVIADASAFDVTVSLTRWEVTLQLQDTDGSRFSIRAICSPDSNLLAGTAIEGEPVRSSGGQPLPPTGFGLAGLAVAGAVLATVGLGAIQAARGERDHDALVGGLARSRANLRVGNPYLRETRVPHGGQRPDEPGT
jgi:hypothetical protein